MGPLPSVGHQGVAPGEDAAPGACGQTVSYGGGGYRVSMSDKLRLTINYEEPDEDGWIVASIVEVPGALSQGRTKEEARENVIDALRLMLTPDDGAPEGQSEPLDLILSA